MQYCKGTRTPRPMLDKIAQKWLLHITHKKKLMIVDRDGEEIRLVVNLEEKILV